MRGDSARALRSLGPDAGANARRMAEAEFDADAIYDGYVRLVTAGGLRIGPA